MTKVHQLNTGMLTRPKKNFEAEAEATMYEAEAEAEAEAGHVRVHQD